MRVIEVESKDRVSKVTRLRPVMKSLTNVTAMPYSVVGDIVMAKADGEFDICEFNRDSVTTVTNRWGKERTDFPAVNELAEALKPTLLHATLKVELYGRENGRMVKLPQFIHLVKSHDPTDHEKVFMGIFDVVKINTYHVVNQPLEWKLEEASRWVKDLKHVHVLPYQIVKSKQELEAFWNLYVEQQGYEGVVVTDERTGNVWKVKPEADIDAVIVALKKTKSYLKQEIATVQVALMNPDNTFVVTADVSNFEKDLRKKLFTLTQFQVGEDKEYVYVHPHFVIKVAFTDIYAERTNGQPIMKPRLKWNGSAYQQVGTQKFYSLRHPRFVDFVKKEVNPTDLRITQIPQPQEAKQTT